MTRHIDRIFGWLLVIGGLLHGFGALKSYEPQTALLVWALSGSLAAILLAAINLMRVNRPHDQTMARVAFVGSLCWAAITLAFGMTIDNLFDPRVLYHAVVALVLAALSLPAAIRNRSVV